MDSEGTLCEALHKTVHFCSYLSTCSTWTLKCMLVTLFRHRGPDLIKPLVGPQSFQSSQHKDLSLVQDNLFDHSGVVSLVFPTLKVSISHNLCHFKSELGISDLYISKLSQTCGHDVNSGKNGCQRKEGTTRELPKLYTAVFASLRLS